MSDTKSMRGEFGAFLVERGKIDPSLVVLDADLSVSTRTSLFKSAFPERFFDMGIAEQDMVGAAIGLALTGKTVVASGFTVFTLGRALDFVKLAAHEQLPVKICTTHSGLSPAQDGWSHQCFEDIAITSSIPGLNVVAPADGFEARQALEHVMDDPHPYFVRLTRNPSPRVVPPDYRFEFGRIQEIVPGSDATIFAVGGMVDVAVSAASDLHDKGINVGVRDASTIKPLDSRTIIDCARATGRIVVVEEHNVLTGLGAQISAIVGKEYPVPVELIGMQDTFGQSGEEQELLEQYGLSASQIVEKIEAFLKQNQEI
jgi:transketolase